MMMDAMPAIDDEQIIPTLSIVQNYMIKILILKTKHKKVLGFHSSLFLSVFFMSMRFFGVSPCWFSDR